MLKRGQKLFRRDFTARTIAGAFPVGAVAQTAWPQRPIRFIVPNAAGRSVDTICRVVANQLSVILRQAIVVDNRTGATGDIGIEAGRSAAPDGYSLIIASSSSITVAPLLLKVVTYKPLVDFDFIALIALLPSVLVCTLDLNVRTTAELISYAKSKSGKTNMASAGNSSASQLTGLAFQNTAGFESVHVPYRCGGAGSGGCGPTAPVGPQHGARRQAAGPGAIAGGDSAQFRICQLDRIDGTKGAAAADRRHAAPR